jgi:hypothetical protein
VFATRAAAGDVPTPVDRDYLAGAAVIGENVYPFIAITGRASNHALPSPPCARGDVLDDAIARRIASSRLGCAPNSSPPVQR